MSDENVKCTAPGLNRIACLNTTSLIAPCFWDANQGICMDFVITDKTLCDLTNVSFYACTLI